MLKEYTLLYRGNKARIFDGPLLFKCHAENVDHAEEQLWDENPGVEILWVVETHDSEEALRSYYFFHDEHLGK